ncbi:MAG: M48 family metallopeptidase [Pseudomonadota bacterium]
MSISKEADRIRCSSDRDLCNTLLEDRTVKRVNEQLERLQEKTPTGIRRRLLATSVRLTRGMAPALHDMADDCIGKLGMEIPLELYVFASAQFNAMCFKPEDGRLFVMFASSLLEAFTEPELRFVMGHELGHHVYQHHDIPIGYILRGDTRPDPRLALQLFTWSRYAEISADRAGAYCAGDLQAVASSLFKLSSGLVGRSMYGAGAGEDDNFIKFNMEDFLNQVDEMQIEDAEPGAGAPKEDWFSTHPFSPLRVHALKLFHDSEFMRADGTDADNLEVGVQGLMSLMEPSYLEGRTETAEAMRRLLFAGALVVANAHGGISEDEIALFEKFFGKDAFTDSLDLDALERDLADRIGQVKEQATEPQRIQVLRDLCLVARAEDMIEDEEREVLNMIADGLGISRNFVSQALDAAVEPD